MPKPSSTSPSTDGSFPIPTPSPRSSHSSDHLPIAEGSDAYELRPLPAIEHGPRDALGVPHGEEAELLPSPRRFSISSVQSYELYTPDEDLAVLRKLDRRLVLFMALLYCLSFLDRSSELILGHAYGTGWRRIQMILHGIREV